MGVCANDASFGPASACRDTDFTLAFESIVFSVVPNLLFLLPALAELVSYRRKPVVVVQWRSQPAFGRALLAAKSVALGALLALSLACAALWPDRHWSATLAWSSSIVATVRAAFPPCR